jgi:hypothetical protein
MILLSMDTTLAAYLGTVRHGILGLMAKEIYTDGMCKFGHPQGLWNDVPVQTHVYFHHECNSWCREEL